jgi:acetate CoA/acetoacetate CoA-transferase alpha subunit
VNVKITTAPEALSIVRDGMCVAANFWGPGTPTYLWRMLLNQGVKNLTLCINNYVPKTDVVRDKGSPDPSILLSRTRKIITAFSARPRDDLPAMKEVMRRITEHTLEFESMSHGILIERLLAGAMRQGGFYSPIGIGTDIEIGKEKRTINGKEYIFQEPLIPDVGLISAAKADTVGNLVYHGTARANNPIIAMASRYTIAEVFEIVEHGELEPDAIVTPGIFVDWIVLIPENDTASKQRRMEWIRASIAYREQQKMDEAAEIEAARGIIYERPPDKRANCNAGSKGIITG